jgi:molybdopterin-guanine dinucleotide biosynthesis protein B
MVSTSGSSGMAENRRRQRLRRARTNIHKVIRSPYRPIPSPYLPALLPRFHTCSMNHHPVAPLARSRPRVRSARPLIALVGSSGSGKTTLIESLLPRFADAGVRVAVVKHAHRGLELDRPGKDTHRATVAGAAQVVVGSGGQWAVMGRMEQSSAEPSLEWLITRLDLAGIDFIIAEGFHYERCPKIEVYRPAHGRAPLCFHGDPDLMALATDVPPALSSVPVLDLNDPAGIFRFIQSHVLATSSMADAV